MFSGVSLAGSKIPPGPTMRNFDGDVAVRPGSSDIWESVKEQGFKLKNGSTIRTVQGSAEISCPDGSIFKFERDTAATLSIAGDGRVQINTIRGSVNATLGGNSITTQMGPDQILQEKYNPKKAEIDISCVNGNLVLIMPNGAKVALTKGDVITLSLKDKSVKVQDGTVEVTKGTKKIPLNAGSQVYIPRNKPFYVRQFPVVRGRYGNMIDPFATNEEYAYTEEYDSQQDVSSAEESATDKEEASPQDEQEGKDIEDASQQKEDLEDTESTEGQSLQQDDRDSSLEQDAQETEASGSGAADDDGGGGGDSGGGE